jgi:hypothetical protein
MPPSAFSWACPPEDVGGIHGYIAYLAYRTPAEVMAPVLRFKL